MQSVRAEIEIAAPRDVVWRILADLSGYAAWNPFTPRVDGALGIGNEVTLHVVLTAGRKPRLQRQRITELEPGARLDWETKLGHPMLLRAVRTQRLVALADGRTRYTTCDTFTGALVGLVLALYRADMEAGFAAMARALKACAEPQAR